MARSTGKTISTKDSLKMDLERVEFSETISFSITAPSKTISSKDKAPSCSQKGPSTKDHSRKVNLQEKGLWSFWMGKSSRESFRTENAKKASFFWEPISKLSINRKIVKWPKKKKNKKISWCPIISQITYFFFSEMLRKTNSWLMQPIPKSPVLISPPQLFDLLNLLGWVFQIHIWTQSYLTYNSINSKEVPLWAHC